MYLVTTPDDTSSHMLPENFSEKISLTKLESFSIPNLDSLKKSTKKFLNLFLKQLKQFLDLFHNPVALIF